MKVRIVTYHRGSGENALVANARRMGVDAIAIPERGSLDTSVIPAMKQIVGDHRPDVLQSHNVKSHLLIRLTGLFKQYPWVAFNHGYTASDARDRLYNQLDRFSLRGAWRVVAVCGPFADRLVRRGVERNRIRVQHNSVKPFDPPSAESLASARKTLGIGDDPVVLCVGRLSGEKGHADLLEAAALLAKRMASPFRVLLAGDGPERDRLVATAERLGIRNRVIMAGFQGDIRPYYALATILALPSHSEGSPNVVLEAMAANLPLVATRVGGVPEIVESGKTGIVVPPHDPPAMAGAMEQLLGDEDLRSSYACAAASEIARRFTPEAYRESLAIFYRDVLRTWGTHRISAR